MSPCPYHNTDGEHDSCTVCGVQHWDWMSVRAYLPCEYCNFPTPGRLNETPVCKICIDSVLYRMSREFAVCGCCGRNDNNPCSNTADGKHSFQFDN